ncbi:hypothetical protein, partial [Dyella sp.]|uniref:hypothetical protein n=1 Tax=Dyella sp. TaxID=1869338 RepID=UPI002FDB86BE
ALTLMTLCPPRVRSKQITVTNRIIHFRRVAKAASIRSDFHPAQAGRRLWRPCRVSHPYV